MFFRGTPWRFAFHPAGRLLACGEDGGGLEIYDLIARERLVRIEAFPDDISGQFGDGKFWGLEFSPDGRLLAGCSRGCSEVRVWDTTSWDLRFELVGHEHHRNESVTFSADSSTILTGGNDGTARTWDTRDGSELLVFGDHSDPKGRLTAVDFHPDGERVLSVESAGEIKVWKHATGEVLLTMEGQGYCNFAGFCADGSHLVSEHGGRLKFWCAETGALQHEVTAIPPSGMHTIFGGANQSRNRRTIVTAGWSGQVKLWDVEERRETSAFSIDLG